MDCTLNRRNFVKAASIAGGAVAAAAALRTNTAHAYEAAPWMPEAWDAEADAVIIGYGAAGASAAIELANQGYTSLLIEKMDKEYAGGDCSVCGGYLTDGGFTPEGYVVSSLGDVDTTYAEAVVPMLNDAFSFLVGLGVPMQDGIPVVAPAEGEAIGQTLYHAIESAVEQRADMITVMYETPGIDLVQDPVTREVLGVKAGSKDAPVYLKANRGVIVASGSYESDREMTNRIHMPGLLFPTIGSPANTGDGLKMLMRAGCQAQNFGKCLEYACMGAKQGSEEVGTGLAFPKSMYADSYIFVNCAGERFMDETASLQHSKNDYIFQCTRFEGGLGSNADNTRYTNMPAFIVFDEAVLAGGPLAGTHGNGNGWNVHGIYSWSQDNQAEVEKGWIVKADTLEELAEKCHATDLWDNDVTIDPASLSATVEKYNAACESGEDADFGRTALVPLAKGPYYAMEIIPITLYATGGAAHDTNAQALDWENQPIGRLYMAGLVGDPWSLHSSAVVGAVTWGRIAARSIATLEPWE